MIVLIYFIYKFEFLLLNESTLEITFTFSLLRDLLSYPRINILFIFKILLLNFNFKS